MGYLAYIYRALLATDSKWATVTDTHSIAQQEVKIKTKHWWDSDADAVGLNVLRCRADILGTKAHVI